MLHFLFPLFALAVLSEEELRFSYADKQGLDSSCGIAVTSSLLNYYWNIPMKEAELYQGMIENQSAAQEGTYTVSFVTIADQLAQHSIVARAYRMDWAALLQSLQSGFAPIVINYAKPTPHFVLLLGIHGDYAFIADPAKGWNLVHRESFLANYSGNALLAASNAVPKSTETLDQALAVGDMRLTRLTQISRHRRSVR